MAAPRYEDSLKDIKVFASKVYRRLRAAGASSVQLEDIIQELSLVWVKASQAYDENGGAQFRTFFYRAMIRHINRWADRQCNEGRALSLDVNVSDDIDKGASFHEVIADGSDSAEDTLAETTHRNLLMSYLSDISRKFVSFLERPPEELVKEFEAIRAKSDYSRGRGLQSIAPRSITSAVIMDFLGVPNKERRGILNEIKTVSERISQC